jgi:hypothetical protein
MEVSKGFFEANLGGYVLKKRIATKNRGKSGSVRVIVIFKKGLHCFFVYGFEKNEKDNITVNEEKAFKIIAKELLNYTDIELDRKVGEGKLQEINDA